MKFEQALKTLKPNSVEEAKLIHILRSWERVFPYEISNLIAESFLDDPVMQHIVIKLCETSDSWTFLTLRQELEKHFYSWMQLKGGECSINDADCFGIIIPLETLNNFLLTHSKFYQPRQIDAFIDELLEQDKPGEWVKLKGFDKLRVKPSQYICWFFWDPQQQVIDPLQLFKNKTSSQICDALNLEVETGQLIAMSFDMKLSRQELNGWQLYRPTWVEGGFFRFFKAVKDQRLGYGIVNPKHELSINGKESYTAIAEGVSRSAFVQLKYLKNVQIF